MSARIRLSIVAVAAVAAIACDDERAETPTAPVGVGPNEISAYIAASNASPSTGDRVTISIRARRGSAVGPIGSFTLRLDYDATRLRFVESARSARGMVLANGAVAGIVRGAGASSDGFTDDELLTSTFDVLGADALASLRLDVTELNSVKFEDQRASMRVAPGLFRDASAGRK
jgi:hypothetical protein